MKRFNLKKTVLHRTGLLVVLEGPDGCGKTNTLRDLQKLLDNTNLPYFYTKEPAGTPLGKKIHKKLIDPKIHLSESQQNKLFMEARQDHIQNFIKPAFKGHKLIICDRYLLSNMAYQGNYKRTKVQHTRYHPYSMVMDRNRILYQNLKHVDFGTKEPSSIQKKYKYFPDLDCIIDAKPTILTKRLKGRKNKMDKYDKKMMDMKYATKIRYNYAYALNDLGSYYTIIPASISSKARAKMMYNKIVQLLTGDTSGLYVPYTLKQLTYKKV